MKKRNRVLEILICTALAAVVFLAYMVTAEDKGTFEIVDKEGDRAYLEAFAFEGLAGDETGQLHYVWKDGELTTDYYPTGAEQTNDILYPLRQGETGFGRYFKELTYDGEADFEIEAAPNPNAAVRKITKMEEVEESIKETYDESSWMAGMTTVNGVETDIMDIYVRINDFTSRKVVRVFTGLQFSGKDCQFVRFESEDGNSSISPLLSYDYMEQLGFFAVELEDAWFGILQTGKDCEGEVFLLRMPKDGMISSKGAPYDGGALYSTETYGTADKLQTFAVDADNRIIALEKAGKDRLLLARTEENVLLLELYDAEGKRLHQLKTDVTMQDVYEFDMAEMIQREEQLVLWFQITEEVMEEAEQEITEEKSVPYQYQVIERHCFVAEQDSIKALPYVEVGEYVDYQDGTILQMVSVKPEHLAADYWGYMLVGYDIAVTDADTGEVLYRGELVTDFVEDYNKYLSAINIGEKAGFMQDRQQEKDWEKYNEIQSGKRTFSNILPVEGVRYSADWAEGRQYYQSDNSYYHYG